MRILCAIVLAASLPVAAQGPLDAAAQAAKVSSEKGQRQYDLGHFREALALFEQAYDAKPVPSLLFNIGQCHRQLGDLKAAATAYRTFLRLAPESKHRPLAEKVLAEVNEALEKQATAREAPPVGLAESESNGQLAHPESKTMVPRAAVASDESRHQTPRAHRTWPAVVAASAAVVLLGGGAFEALSAQSDTNKLAELNRAGTVSAADDQQLRSSANSKSSTSKALYLMAGAAAVTSVAFWFVF